MKKVFNLLLLAILVCYPLRNYAQSDCNPYFLLKEGKKWTTANYNAKDKYQGKQSYEILSVSGSGNNLTAKVMLISYDKKDEKTFEKEVEFVCKDGVIEIDMTQYMSEQMESFEDMEVKMDMDNLQIPQKLEAGQHLEDGKVTMTIEGPMTMKFSITIKDRKVMSQEDIKVPAGSYNAYKINSISQFDGMGMSRETKSADWIAEDVGVVRTEIYDKKGRLSNYTVLTEYSE